MNNDKAKKQKRQTRLTEKRVREIIRDELNKGYAKALANIRKERC